MISARKPLSRWQAAGIHVLGSLTLAVIASLLIFALWYPQPYTEAAGADRLIMLLIGIDLALGPLCTLVVWRVGKKGLWFDLVVITSVQISALVYGLIVIAESRPAFIVVTRDVTYLTMASSLAEDNMKEATRPEHARASWTGPLLVAAPPPDNPEDRNRLIDLGMMGRDINVFPKYYRTWQDAGPALIAQSPSLSRLRERPEAQAAVDAFLRELGRGPEGLHIQALRGRDPISDSTIVFDAREGIVVGVIDVDPWSLLSDRPRTD
jgi:hypothetical protein